MVILIPAFEPDERLLELIKQLQMQQLTRILLIDDGSELEYRPIFELAEASGCRVLRHEKNRGKGCALKTGFQYLLDQGCTEGVICADSDGQHLPGDIVRAAMALSEQGGIVLGSRRFSGKVPLRSRFGNTVTRTVYALMTGSGVHDTQTGLRGYSPDMLKWLCGIPGDRFEYEMNLLLAAHKEGITVKEIFIDTVYIDENRSSHFRPLADSFRIYLPILLFSASSLIAGLIDFILLLLLKHFTGSLFLAVAGARLCSSTLNYVMNRSVVFRKGDRTSSVARSMPRYLALVLLILMLNYGFLSLFHTFLAVPIVPAKLLTEGVLFLFSYWAQRRFVY